MIRVLLFAILLAGARPAVAASHGENLLVAVPPDYSEINRSRQGNFLLAEFAPKGQTTESWTDLITVTINFGGIPISDEEYEARFAAHWAQSCPSADYQSLLHKDEGGYAVRLFLLYCSASPQSGRPEWTMIKTLTGNDSFYTVQKAFRRKPDRAALETWTSFLGSVRLCDSRIEGRECPSGK